MTEPIWCLLNWPTMNNQTFIARRTERDIGKPIPIDNVTSYGVDLNTQIFDVQGYASYSLFDIGVMLGVGVQIYFVDFYWNEYTLKWQLCPGPIPNNFTDSLDSVADFYWKNRKLSCEPGLTITQLMQQFNKYMGQTNSVQEANSLQLVVRLKTIGIKQTNLSENSIYNYSMTPNYQNIGNNTLSNSITPLGNFIFTPLDLEMYSVVQESNPYNTPYNDTSKFPTLDTYLLTLAKRILINVVEDDLTKSPNSYNTTDDDTSNIFFPDTNITNIVEQNSNALLYNCQNAIQGGTNLLNYGNFNYVLDSNSDAFENSTFKDYLRCGYMPIFSANKDLVLGNLSIGEKLNDFIPWGYWSWAVDQPMSEQAIYALNYNNDGDDGPQQNSSVAYKCVSLHQDGFKVDNCYQEYPYACKDTENPANWYVDSKIKKRYFDSYKDDACKPGYELSIPRLATDALLLIRVMADSNIDYPVWIDLNDITVTECFVTGGPYAECPYFQVYTRSKLIKQLAPSFTIAGLIIILVFMEKFFRINPIQTNRKTYWKRVINEYNDKNAFEGVPA